MTDDDMDPNVFMADDHEYRIYADDTGDLYAIVDRIDYQWAIQWRWSPMWSRGNRKIYLRRNLQVLHAKQEIVDGQRLRIRTQRSLRLHVAIMERMEIPPPTPQHVLVDHRNGRSLDCRRDNLRWATHSMNRRNLKGCFSGVEDF